MLTPIQEHRYNLYIQYRSLAKVSAFDGVSRECVRLTLESIPEDSEEYRNYRAIASESKGGRPRQYSDRRAQRRESMRNWRAKQKLQVNGD
jgi:hypothetical protein